MSLRTVRSIAKEIGIKGIINHSTRKYKRFMITMSKNGKEQTVHFGLKGGSTFIDHHDPIIKKAWRARHSKIRLKDGRLTHKVRGTPSYYSWNLLW